MSTAAERAGAALAQRRADDFQFMVVAASKGNMGFYAAFRDRSLDTPPVVHPPQGPASAYENI